MKQPHYSWYEAIFSCDLQSCILSFCRWKCKHFLSVSVFLIRKAKKNAELLCFNVIKKNMHTYLYLNNLNLLQKEWYNIFFSSCIALPTLCGYYHIAILAINNFQFGWGDWYRESDSLFWKSGLVVHFTQKIRLLYWHWNLLRTRFSLFPSFSKCTCILNSDLIFCRAALRPETSLSLFYR